MNPDNPSSFDIMLSRVIDTSELGFEPQIFKSNAIIIPKVSMELSDESNIVITNLQSRITFKEPVANIAKLLVLSDASLKSDLEIKFSIILEEINEDNNDVELNMLLGLQKKLTDMIMQKIVKK